MKKRDRLEVINDILDVISKNRNKIGPTRLLFASNLSPKMFKDYITELKDKGLIEEKEEKKKRFYSLTDEGFRFLEKFGIFKNFVDNLGL